MGALNTKRIFFIPALAPATLNITIILCVLFFATRVEEPIFAVAWGVVLGGFIQLAIQLPSFFRSGYSLHPDCQFKHAGLRKMAVLMVPATMGMAVAQINIFVSTILASYLPEGSITYLYYSMRLIQFPVGVFGVAMGMAVLPSLSEHAVRGDYDKLREDFSYALRLLFFITVPAMAGLIALREPIVHILFQRGQFDYAATVKTAHALLFYSIGIWSMVVVRIATAGFYSMQDTRTPVKIAAVAVAANIIFSIVLMQPLRHSGLALANSLASVLNFLILFLLLRKRLVKIDGRRIFTSFFKSILASVIMGMSAWFFVQGVSWEAAGNTLQKVFSLTGTILLCIGMYLCLVFLLKSEELKSLAAMFKKRFGKSNT